MFLIDPIKDLISSESILIPLIHLPSEIGDVPLTRAIKELTTVLQSIERVKNGDNGHYAAWVEACIAGPGSKEAKVLSSNFDIAGPLTESVLMGNLAIRSYDVKANDSKGLTSYPGRNIQLMWDGPNMKITNFDLANQFVKRTYREGWSLGA